MDEIERDVRATDLPEGSWAARFIARFSVEAYLFLVEERGGGYLSIMTYDSVTKKSRERARMYRKNPELRPDTPQPTDK